MSAGGYSALFGSLNGSYNAMSSMNSLLRDYNTIKSGSYSKLMKSYVGKVGNKAALNAYQKDGTTVQNATEIAADKKTSSTSSSSGTSTASSSTAKSSSAASSASSYSKYRSSWLDNHLTQYSADATKKTDGADTAAAVDTAI